MNQKHFNVLAQMTRGNHFQTVRNMSEEGCFTGCENAHHGNCTCTLCANLTDPPLGLSTTHSENCVSSTAGELALVQCDQMPQKKTKHRNRAIIHGTGWNAAQISQCEQRGLEAVGYVGNYVGNLRGLTPKPLFVHFWQHPDTE